MKTAIGIFVLIIALFFLWFDNFVAAVLLFLLALIILLKKPLKTLGKEVMDDLEKTEGQVPDAGVFKDGIKEAGARIGEQTFSDNESPIDLEKLTVTKYKFKPNKTGEASNKVIEAFKRLFS